MAVPDKDKDNGKKGSRVITQAMRDKSKAMKRAAMLGSPYDKAASAIKAEAARGMSDEEISAKFSPEFDAAASQAANIGTNASNLYGNTAGIVSGFAKSLPGADNYDVSSVLGGITSDFSGAATLGNQFGLSLANDIRNQATTSISGAEARRDERSDRLNSEARSLNLQGDVASADWQTQLNNILTTRSARMDLASKNLSLKQQREDMARAKRGSGGSGGGGGDGSGDGTIESTDPTGSGANIIGLGNMIGGTAAQRAAASRTSANAAANLRGFNSGPNGYSPSYQPITDMINSNSSPQGRYRIRGGING